MVDKPMRSAIKLYVSGCNQFSAEGCYSNLIYTCEILLK